jgi:23S rRNA pseudouridine2604 synthase
MALSKTYDGPEPVRVNKWLAQSGVASRREAEDLIARGLVSVDGTPVKDPGHKILPGQTLTLQTGSRGGGDGATSKLTAVLNKPVGYVSAQPERGQIPAARLVRPDTLVGTSDAIPGRDASLAPLGRLDMDSRGLLILSDDGVLAKAVIGPASNLDKEYLVRVTGQITERAVSRLCHGLSLDGRQLKPAKVTQIQRDALRFVLREGRNRQIRRMAELVGLYVTDLYRIRIGPVHIGDLPEGRWRALTLSERRGMLGK